MKKLTIFALVLLLFIGSVYASAFAVIGMTGLSFTNPEAASIVRNAMCVTSPAGVASCASSYAKGQVVGEVTGEAFEKIAEASPEAAQSISTYNQIKGYVDTGATILEELELDSNGQVQKGTIQFYDKGGEIGNLIGEDVKKEDIVVSEHILFDKRDGVSTLVFVQEGSHVKVGDSLFGNIKKKDGDTNAHLKLNEKGDLMEADFTTTKEGGNYVIGGDWIDVPPNSRVIFKDGKIEVFVSDNVSPFKASTVEGTELEGNLIELKGNNIKLPNGAVLEDGILSYRDGQAFVQETHTAVISGVRIDQVYEGFEQERLVFFDGLAHDPNIDYVSINALNKNLIVHANRDGKPISLTFKEGNPFLRADEKDDVRIGIFSSADISIKNRDSEGLIPLVLIKATSPEGDANIVSGLSYVSLSQNKESGKSEVLTGIFETGDVTSSPMSITFRDSKNKNILGTAGEPKKMLISNFNEIGVIPISEKEYIINLKSLAKAPGKISETFNFNYQPAEDFKGLFQNIEMRQYDLGKQLTATELKALTDNLAYLPEELRNSIRGIYIYDDETYDKNPHLKGGAAYTNKDRIIRIRSSTMGSLTATLHHEAAHDLTYLIEKDINFKASWNQIVGRNYGGDLTDPSVSGVGGRVSNIWVDGTRDPKNGFVSAYGSNNFLEDVATYVEKAYTEPNIFKELITKGGPKYDPTYMQKLLLLKEYGFITDEAWGTITTQ